MSIKTSTIKVNLVSNLFSIKPADGDRVETLGYTAVGDGGANLYYYDVDASGTPDGGFILPGVGGTLSFDASGVFDGTEGTGRFMAVDQSVVNLAKFGGNSKGQTNAVSSDAAMVQAISAARKSVVTGSNGTQNTTIYIPSGGWLFTQQHQLYDYISVRGDGIKKTNLIFEPDSGTDGEALFYAEPDGYPADQDDTLKNVSFSGFQLTLREGTVTNARYGIKLERPKRSVIHDIEFNAQALSTDRDWVGIRLSRESNIIERCHFESLPVGVMFDWHSNHCIVRDCTFVNTARSTLTLPWAAIHCTTDTNFNRCEVGSAVAVRWI